MSAPEWTTLKGIKAGDQIGFTNGYHTPRNKPVFTYRTVVEVDGGNVKEVRFTDGSHISGGSATRMWIVKGSTNQEEESMGTFQQGDIVKINKEGGVFTVVGADPAHADKVLVLDEFSGKTRSVGPNRLVLKQAADPNHPSVTTSPIPGGVKISIPLLGTQEERDATNAAGRASEEAELKVVVPERGTAFAEAVTNHLVQGEPLPTAEELIAKAQATGELKEATEDDLLDVDLRAFWFGPSDAPAPKVKVSKTARGEAVVETLRRDGVAREPIAPTGKAAAPAARDRLRRPALAAGLRVKVTREGDFMVATLVAEVAE